MKLHEAVRAARESNGELWCRPVGYSQAFAVDGGYTKVVPTARGGNFGMTADSKYLEGDWETLTPAQFYAENEE